MKNCRSCQKEIDSKAKKCPYCQSKQDNWVVRHPILTGIVAVVVFLILVGVMSGKSTSPQKVTTDAQGQTITTSQTPAAATQTFNVGDVVKLGDYQFTVNKVDKSPSVRYSSPKAGNEYIAVTVTIQNTGTKEVAYNPYDFKIQNSNGNQTDQALVSLDDALSSGSLAAGGKVTGSMPFEVPKGDMGLKLIYQPSIWSNDQRVTVNLQ